jgi:hypothetical protein
MTEIYINNAQYVYLDIYGATAAGTPDAILISYNYGGTTSAAIPVSLSATAPAGVTQRWSAKIPTSASDEEKTLTVQWDASISGSNVVQTEGFDVVTPYAMPAQFAGRYGLSLDPQSPNYMSYESIVGLERTARKIIESYVGISFGKRRKSLTAYGANTDVLSLGEYVASVDKLYENGVLVWTADGSVDDFGYSVEVSDTGQGIRIVNNGFNIEESEPGAFMPPGKFREGYRYDVLGLYGFQYVPTAVNEATLILCNDLLGKDATYRSHYMAEVAVRDWSFKFDSQAFNGTGNAVVDQLLSPWVAPWIAVI